MDPVKAMYEIENLPMAIEKLTQTTLRNVIGELDLDECLTSRDTINMKLRQILDEASNKWGCEGEPRRTAGYQPPRDIREAMEKQMRAERDKRAQIVDAEGSKRAAVLQAEGVQQAEIAHRRRPEARPDPAGRGRCTSTHPPRTGRSRGHPTRFAGHHRHQGRCSPTTSSPLKYLETLKEMTSGQGNKAITSLTRPPCVLGSVGGIKDMLDANKSLSWQIQQSNNGRGSPAAFFVQWRILAVLAGYLHFIAGTTAGPRKRETEDY
ncbi:MAG: hypothetical protein IPL77_10660 [Flavobacteriales bacterium]|nr:hypothetical protein [Flavobacteriales bacterium]